VKNATTSTNHQRARTTDAVVRQHARHGKGARSATGGTVPAWIPLYNSAATTLGGRRVGAIPTTRTRPPDDHEHAERDANDPPPTVSIR